MKKKPSVSKPVKLSDLDAACERNRQACNKLSDEERRHYRDLALRTIYSTDAETPARRR
jgi:hypothetical protein